MTAPTLLGTEETTDPSGNITIPATCDFVVALRHDGDPPTLGGTALTEECVSGDAGIYSRTFPATGTVAYTYAASWLYFRFGRSGGNAIAGHDVHGSYEQSLSVGTDDIMVGVLQGTGGDQNEFYLEFHSVSATELYNSDDEWMTGYLGSASGTELCSARDETPSAECNGAFMSVTYKSPTAGQVMVIA